MEEKGLRRARKESRRGGGRISTRSESKHLEISRKEKEKYKSKQGQTELKTKKLIIKEKWPPQQVIEGGLTLAPREMGLKITRQISNGN